MRDKSLPPPVGGGEEAQMCELQSGSRCRKSHSRTHSSQSQQAADWPERQLAEARRSWAGRLTWPQELGQPVQCMRTLRGKSSCCSSLATMSMARFLVSMMATPQNWDPVQETRPRVRPATTGT